MIPSRDFSFDYELLVSRAGITPFNNFSIIVNGEEYKCNSLVASSFSEGISELFLSNSLANSIHISLEEGPFNLVNKYLQGGEINVTAENAKYMAKAAIELRIPSLLELAGKSIEKTLSGKEALEFAERAFSHNCDISCFITAIAKEFADLVKDGSFKNTREEILDLVLSRKPQIDTKELIQFLLQYFNFDENPNHRLSKYYPFGAIDRNTAESILRNPDLNLSRLATLLPIFTKADPGKSDNQLLTIDFEPGQELMGLTRCAIRPAVSASSVLEGNPENLTFERGYLVTSAEEKPSVSFEFVRNAVSLSGYVICAESFLNVGVAPKKWILEGSINGASYTVLDERQANLTESQLNFFPVNCDGAFYRFVRFTQLESTTPGDSRLALSQVEFFGTLKKS